MTATATKPSKVDPRHTARSLALQQLFNYYVTSTDKSKLPGEYDPFSLQELMELYEQEECNEELYNSIIVGVKEHQVKIDNAIKKLAPLWPIEQISLIDLIILRIGIWEAFMERKTPEKVSIDEAIELAKEFSGETTAKFVNGVLGNLLKNKELQTELQS